MKSCGDEYHLRGKIRLDIEVYCKYQEIPADEPTKCDPGGGRCSGKTKTPYNKNYLIATHG
jgi:hypothetical protein